MRVSLRSVALFSPLLLTACFFNHHPKQVQPVAPPISNTPAPTPAPAPIQTPVPAQTTPAQPKAPAPTTSTQASQQPSEAPKPPVHKKKPVNKNPLQAANGNGASNGVSAIGQLSAGEPSDLRRQTSDSIASTERGLNSITRALNDQEQRTASHIREFLKLARAAIISGDVDGAHTLAVKAKILLGELTR